MCQTLGVSQSGFFAWREAELPRPRMRSPSQCPGTALSPISAGRLLIISASAMNGLPRFRPRSRGRRRARPREQKHLLLQPPLRWRDLLRHPARTGINSHAARLVDVLARTIYAASSARISVFLSSSTPPRTGCCDDRLNPPNTALSITKPSFANAAS